MTEQREELKEAALREGLLRHADQSARPVRAYPQLDKLSTAWKLSLPGITNGLSTPVFKEVIAQHLGLPSPACLPLVGQRIGSTRAVLDPHGFRLSAADVYTAGGVPPGPKHNYRTGSAVPLKGSKLVGCRVDRRIKRSQNNEVASRKSTRS